MMIVAPNSRAHREKEKGDNPIVLRGLREGGSLLGPRYTKRRQSLGQRMFFFSPSLHISVPVTSAAVEHNGWNFVPRLTFRGL